uniref:Uncharacterized protein n=1 Tax=uncultured bacterium Contig643 TaxID=1393602 RepID=W0FH65_9BACT|nr:hypothetical protein [uncultured bacterium Contig643]
MSNHSEWRVSNNPMLGDKPYQVYRLKDKDKVDHSGNREYHHGGQSYSERGRAEHIAKVLNDLEERLCR